MLPRSLYLIAEALKLTLEAADDNKPKWNIQNIETILRMLK